MGVERFTLRLTGKQHEVLERRASEANKSKNQYIVDLIVSDDISDLGSIGLNRRVLEMQAQAKKMENLIEKQLLDKCISKTNPGS